LKRRVDSSEARGQYFLTGSQNLALLKTVSESLAGRVGILHLSAMTPRELAREAVDPSWLEPFLSGAAPLPDVLPPPFGADPELFRALWRGCLPGTLDLPDRLVPDYLRSYVETYLERDVRRTADPGDLTAFGRFLGLSAAMTGQESNDSQAGREVGVSPQTARRWYASLSATYQWLEVPPYTRNAVKRVSRRCKGHLHDSGLACHLQRISSPEALSVSPLLGALFETWVHNALRGQFAALAVAPDVLHWRSAGGAEVDLVLERDGMLFPVEVKCKAHPGGHDGRGLRAFRDTYGPDRVRPALLVHGGTDCYRLDPDTWAVPWTRI
jgi:predicted AAA+ superfamily ATPase